MPTKARLVLVEDKYARSGGKPDFRVERIRASTAWTIGQLLKRDEVEDLIQLGSAEVTIQKRKDQ